MTARSLPRRLFGLLVTMAALLVVGSSAYADQELPAQLLGDFIAKVAVYDRNFQARARPRALVVVLQRGGDNGSARLASGIERRLQEKGTIAGLPVDVESVNAESPAAIAAMCKTRHVAVLVFSTGLDDQVADIAAALDQVDVLSFGASSGYAQRGAVIAVEAREGKPHIVVNMARARAQNVAFGAELLKLAEVLP